MQKKEMARKTSASRTSYPGYSNEPSAKNVPIESIPITKPQITRLGKGMKLGKKTDSANYD